MKQKGISAQISVAAAVLAGLILGGFYLTSGGEINLGLEDNGRTLEVSAGTVVVIKIPENPTTGYMWQYTVNESIAEVVEDNFIPPEEPIPGKGGTRVLKLTIIGSGELTMEYVRPWENQPIDYFSVTFRV